ncbi:hypothetical protein GE061_002921 [Apolygus lucorum]|uniref:Uncharacterized protein n=1 Tax=Apolygus lucorum TaxID=248454 RepID=A0A6A4JI17_APOLU|nr:hypothetical protein GE061_002921 [Apolygus lucorum]
MQSLYLEHTPELGEVCSCRILSYCNTHWDTQSDLVEKVARKLHGSRGPNRSNSDQWTDFLLRYGRSSLTLRKAEAALANKLNNEDVPWESIKALMASRLVALDKCPGVRCIGTGECLKRILGKCMAEITAEEVTEACKESQLCAGLSAGIEGAIHALSSMFTEKAVPNSHLGLLLIDAKNAFNSVNRGMALWRALLFAWPIVITIGQAVLISV